VPKDVARIEVRAPKKCSLHRGLITVFLLALFLFRLLRIVRNSWGVTWGQAGYIYLEYGKNMCNLASDATVVKGCAIV
jgi:hypothetical protein